MMDYQQVLAQPDRPFRVCVFGTMTRTIKKRETTVQCGWVAWNPNLTDHWAHQGRLPSSGSFAWLGEAAARQAALAAFADERVTQVQIRTEQDRTLIVFNRHGDKITHYFDD